MKILIINTIKFDINGISTVIMNYYQNMQKNGLDFDFLVNDYIDENYKKIIENNGDKVYLFKRRKSSILKYIFDLYKLVKKNEYNVIHIHGNSSTMMFELVSALLQKSPIVKIVHGHSIETQHKNINFLLKAPFLCSYDFAFAASKEAGSWLYNGAPFTVINNGIEVEKFSFSARKRDFYRNEMGLKDKFVLLNVGRLEENKNQSFLIDVFHELCNVEKNSILLLVGDGSHDEELKAKVKSYNLEDKVIFLGKKFDTVPYFLIADVFVHPSKYESFGIVNIEAQCSGLPCVVSDAIPEEAKITDYLNFLSLQSSKRAWVDEILKYREGYIREDQSELIRSKGFDIIQNANFLKDFYLSLNSK